MSFDPDTGLPTLCVLALFEMFCNFCFDVQTCHHIGGWGMCIFFEICEKKPFQKCMAGGGVGVGGHIFQDSATHWTVHTNMALPVDKTRQRATLSLPKTDKNLEHIVSTACKPGVFRIPLFKGFLNIPHIPPPTGHSADTDEATRAATL